MAGVERNANARTGAAIVHAGPIISRIVSACGRDAIFNAPSDLQTRHRLVELQVGSYYDT